LDEAPLKYICGSLLHLFKAITVQDRFKTPRLWLVTRGAQFTETFTLSEKVEDMFVPPNPMQATLWGLGRVIAIEHPDLHCTLMDLDLIDSANHARDIFSEISADKGDNSPSPLESQIAFRGGVRYAARLVRSIQDRQKQETEKELIAKSSDDLKGLFHPAHSYLITGGYGGLGLLTAQWMVDHGTKFLTLVGRKGANETSKASVEELEKKGCRIQCLRGDISLESDVQHILSEIGNNMPPLKGVIHCAGVLEDGVLLQQNWDRFIKVMAPKVFGAWNLHRLTKNLPLEFFILYSTWASLLGSPGQSNHAAANAFMDSLAYHRRVIGLPAITINWGPWSDKGIAADSRASESLESRGIGGISSDNGLKALEQIIRQNLIQQAVVPLNLDRWVESHPASSDILFFEQLNKQYRSNLKFTEGSFKKGSNIKQSIFNANNATQRKSMLESHIREQVSKILRIPMLQIDSNKSFKYMGLDSLTGLELCNRLGASLGLKVPATAVWNYPTIAHLSLLLADKLGFGLDDSKEMAKDEAANSTMVFQETESLGEILDDLENLSDEEVREILAKDKHK
jgi:myxalamid-type polyketide synthase MxaE and MxaD